MSLTEALGEQREVALRQGVVRYRERGSGEPILFVHGLGVTGDHWRKVVPTLAERFRCITPDWPLGAHEAPFHPDADLSPPGQAAIVDEFMAALALDGVTLVGNDTGGAIAQLVAVDHPGRLGRLVLTPCDAYENFLPRMFRLLQWSARVPGGTKAMLRLLRVRRLRRMPIAFGWLSKQPIDPVVSDAYIRTMLGPGLRDLGKLLRGISPQQTLDAAARLASFDRPTLIAWAREDRFFPVEHAERLAATIPNARLEWVEDSWSFIPEDQPERLAALIADFISETG